ncbi:YihY/virulence factor BrkB family protein [Roseovarius sp. SCSIO 43702]|uniref:YihY/virulence factor BrkB family protein n=1 Tax=Roseovarius sp. SCSIO 43702 TaxID=2823043 RepID=UPI001C73DEB3|nr:YihY/virulence factor BrkB family protein [Roseovarius sp. SCSIO 43702]QYX58283.1 YihY/virulence factor BrkB family protein [Roseovarius sp. SCSIO 43702]
MARGRHAETPTDIPAAGWKDIAFRVKDEIAADRVSLIAAGVAFYALLALFPAITALLAIGGLIVEPSQIVTVLDELTAIMPEDVASIILDQAEKVAGSREGGLGLAAVLGIVLALYSASKGVGSLIEGLNVAYDEEETRNFIWLKVITFGLTLALILGVVLAIILMVAVPAALSFVELGSRVEMLVTGASWLLMLVLVAVALALLYRFGPDRDQPEWSWLSLGSVLACVLWLVASIGFALYVSNFGSYNESFGSLAGVIVLLMWLWLSAFVVLMGAEFNAELEAQTRYDTTVGPDEPMGERDAEKADNLGETAG